MSTDLSPEELAATIQSYWHWYGIATFMRCPLKPDLSDTDVGLIGFPYSGGNAIERMQYLAPRAVRDRAVSYRRSHRGFQVDPFSILRVSDLGDVPLPNILHPDLTARDAEAFYRRVDESGILPITVGGDHSVTTPILRAIAGPSSRRGGPIGMIHLDSHPDAHAAAFGTLHNAGSPFRVAFDEGLIDPARTVQLGFHGSMGALNGDDWSKEHFTVIDLEQLFERGVDWVASEIRRVVGDGPTYFSFDIDILDLAYAPAVADPEVNGMTTRELFSMMNKLRGIDIIGADIVCFCPPLDNPNRVTAMTISEFMVQLLSHIADYRRSAAAR